MEHPDQRQDRHKAGPYGRHLWLASSANTNGSSQVRSSTRNATPVGSIEVRPRVRWACQKEGVGDRQCPPSRFLWFCMANHFGPPPLRSSVTPVSSCLLDRDCLESF